MALDDALNVAPQMGVGRAEQAAISSAKREFVSELERQNPSYGEARRAFRSMSAPANRLEVAQGLLGKVTANPADVDQLGNQVLRPDAFGRAVGGLDKIAQKVTGQKNAKAGDILNSEQQGAVQSLLGDLSRVKVANNVGKSAGSNSIQNLASQNVLNEVAQGIGMPGLAENSILGQVAHFANKGYNLLGVPDKIRDKLTMVMRDPQSPEAQKIIAKMTLPQRKAFFRALQGGSAQAGGLLGMGVAPPVSQSFGR